MSVVLPLIIFPSSLPLIVLFRHLPHRPRRVQIQRSGDCQELDDVDAPFTAFVFRDEALRFTEAVGELLLGQAGLFACGVKQGDEPKVIGRT